MIENVIYVDSSAWQEVQQILEDYEMYEMHGNGD